MDTGAALSRKGIAAKRTRRGPHTRKRILDASLHLFSARGFARTTVRDIAREAGITDAGIFYHFESKRDLLEALVEERGIVAGLQQLQRVSADLPLQETLLWMARGAINIMDENRDFLRLIMMEGLRGAGPAPRADPPPRQVRSPILMASQAPLLGRHVSPKATPGERREALTAFASETLKRLL